MLLYWPRKSKDRICAEMKKVNTLQKRLPLPQK